MRTNKIFSSLLIAAALLTGIQTVAQTIKGTIFTLEQSDHQHPLPGVNIFWINTRTGTTSDANGNFSISAKGITDKRLILSFIGYNTDTVHVGENSTLKLMMTENSKELSAVEIGGRAPSSFISHTDPRKVQVITTGELRKAACCSLAESFETNASVDVMYADALTGAKQIQLLGLSGVYSQILSENVPLVRGLASSFGLSYIPGTWMESILVSKGASSVVNGFESVTGQIMVEYKKPANSEKLFLNFFGNDNTRLEANAHSALKINDRLSTMLFGHVSHFNNPFDRNNDGFMDIPANTTYNFMNRWDFNIPNKFTSHLGVKYFDEVRTGGFMHFDPETFSQDTAGINSGTKVYGIEMHTRRLEGFLKNGIMFPDHPDRSIALIVSGIYHSQNDLLGLNKYDATQKSFYANLLFQDKLVNEHHKFTTGLSFMFDNYAETFSKKDLTYLYQVAGNDQDNIPDSLFTIFSIRDTTLNLDRKEMVPGAFFEYTMMLGDKFTLIAGMRADYHNRYGLFLTPRLHARYMITPSTTLRASAGKGYRSANVLAENYSIMASQRVLHISNNLDQENAWNLGLNVTQDFHLFKREAQFDAEFYRTQFIHQVIVDLDSMPTDVFVYNLNGKSFSNVLQVQLTFEPVKRFTVLTAFRLNDVNITESSKLMQKAMSSRYKGLFNASYATRFDKWKFDFTIQLNGPSRLPDTEKLPEELRRAEKSPAYVQLLAQVTRQFKHFEIYAGGENLTNFTQKDPITEYLRPYHTYFDTSMVWGPIVGATVYGGLRYTLK
jgi:hypothetical protein